MNGIEFTDQYERKIVDFRHHVTGRRIGGGDPGKRAICDLRCQDVFRPRCQNKPELASCCRASQLCGLVGLHQSRPVAMVSKRHPGYTLVIQINGHLDILGQLVDDRVSRIQKRVVLRRPTRCRKLAVYGHQLLGQDVDVGKFLIGPCQQSVAVSLDKGRSLIEAFGHLLGLLKCNGACCQIRWRAGYFLKPRKKAPDRRAKIGVARQYDVLELLDAVGKGRGRLGIGRCAARLVEQEFVERAPNLGHTNPKARRVADTVDP